MTVTLPHEWAKIHAERDSDAPAVVFDASTLSYGELDRRADAHARQLQRCRDRRGRSGRDRRRFGPPKPSSHWSGPTDPGRWRFRADRTPSTRPHRSIPRPTSWCRPPAAPGSPRGVILTGRNVAAAVDASQRRLGNGPHDRWLLTLPLFHVGGLSIVWRSLAAGGSIELHRQFDTDAAICRAARRCGDDGEPRSDHAVSHSRT